jgi:branched-chain amino acid transport system substrate-binding protein
MDDPVMARYNNRDCERSASTARRPHRGHEKGEERSVVTTRFTLSLVMTLMLSGAAHAQISDDKIRIGVLTDLSGGYEQASGNGSVEAAKMAAEEFGSKIRGKPIEIVAGDHQNRPDVGATIANRWFDREQVDAVADLVNSAVGFAVLDVAKAKNKMVLLTSAGSDDFTGKACAPNNSIHWVYDTYQITASIGQVMPALGKTYFIIYADYAFGKGLLAGFSSQIEKTGGKLVGSVAHPLGATDYASYILQAQASKAEVVVFANGGDDGINAAKAAKEFGVTAGGQKIVAQGLSSLPIVKSAGLDVLQGATFVTSWLPDLSEASQAFTKKFVERRHTVPGDFHVGTYSAVLNYLKAVEASDSDDPKKVIAKMREGRVKDAYTNDGVLRPDGRMVHDVYLVQVKTPAESKSEWDLVKLLQTIPGDKAFRPLGQGGCPAISQ